MKTRAAVTDGKGNFRMVTRTYPLDRLAGAFDDMKRGVNAKRILIP